MKEFLIWLIGSLISALGFVYFFCKINDVKKISKFSIFFFCLGVIIMSFFKFYNIKQFSLLYFFIFYPILFYSLCRMHFKNIVVNTLIIWLISMMFDITFMLITSLICLGLSIDVNEYYDIFVVTSSTFIFLILIGLGKSTKFKKVVYVLINKLNDIQYINFVLTAFSLFVCILAICISFELESIKIGTLLTIIIVLSVFIFALLIKYKIDNVENKKYLETLKENNDFYIKMDDENRIFKHNLMAKLSSIKSVSNKKAIALIDDFVIKTNKSILYSKKIKTIPYGINGIIYQKTYPYLEEINFKITNKIDFDIFKVLKPRRYNVLVEKMVVSIDNAIEASLNSKNKVVVINLYDDEDYIYVEIKNTFAYNIDVDNLGNLNYSTKGRKRGLGLFSILRDNEASVKIKVINNYFISTISAKKQK